MPARHFSSVLLPLPLRPAIPKNSPSLNRERDVVERAERLEPGAPARMQRTLFERVTAIFGHAERLCHVVRDDCGEPGFTWNGAHPERGYRSQRPTLSGLGVQRTYSWNDRDDADGSSAAATALDRPEATPESVSAETTSPRRRSSRSSPRTRPTLAPPSPPAVSTARARRSGWFLEPRRWRGR